MWASEAPCSSISKNQMKSLKPGHHIAKILLFRTHHLWNSTTELILKFWNFHLWFLETLHNNSLVFTISIPRFVLTSLPSTIWMLYAPSHTLDRFYTVKTFLLNQKHYIMKSYNNPGWIFLFKPLKKIIGMRLEKKWASLWNKP